VRKGQRSGSHGIGKRGPVAIARRGRADTRSRGRGPRRPRVVGPRAGPISSARPGSTEDVLGPCSCRKRSALVRCANTTVSLQCARRCARPFTTDTLGAAAYRKAYYTHHLECAPCISPKDHPQPWIQDGLKGDSRAAASPCRLRWPRTCRGRGVAALSSKSGGGDSVLVCESRKNTLPYPFGSTTEFKIRWWG